MKFILEGYDNLTTMSTVDRRQGIVELYVPSGNEDLVRELLVSIKTEIGLKTEYRSQNTEVRIQNTEVRSQKSEVGSRSKRYELRVTG